MPLISSYIADDGRVTCRMMAKLALKSLDDRAHRVENFDQLQNAYRMLKSYRLGIFGVPQSYGVGQAVLEGDYDFDEDEMENVSSQLFSAFERAKEAAFPSQNIGHEKAAKLLQEAIQNFVNSENLTVNDKKSIQQTRKFFEALLNELK